MYVKTSSSKALTIEKSAIRDLSLGTGKSSKLEICVNISAPSCVALLFIDTMSPRHFPPMIVVEMVEGFSIVRYWVLDGLKWLCWQK